MAAVLLWLKRVVLQQVINKLYNYTKEQEMNSICQETLRRIEQNDDQLTTLGISGALMSGCFKSSEASDYSRLGAAIGNNTHLTKLLVYLGAVGANPANHNQTLDIANTEFFNGFKRNSSINHLTLHCNGHNLIGGVEHEILKSYQKINNNLTGLCINEAVLDNGGGNVITETLRWCRNLKTINFGSNNITDEQLLPIVEAIKGGCYTSLQVLSLYGNRIGNVGCHAIATLLEHTNCNIKLLSLETDQIGNEGATTIANSLANNTKLKRLYLGGNPFDASAVGIFCTVLCNASSVNDTYLSNHTLKDVLLSQVQQGQHEDHLSSILRLNIGRNKSHVAIRKILKYHPNIEMEPLFEWDAEGEQTLKALPHVVAWFERAEEAVADEDDNSTYHVEKKKLSAIFQFAKAMPLFFVQPSYIDEGSKKRKRD